MDCGFAVVQGTARSPSRISSHGVHRPHPACICVVEPRGAVFATLAAAAVLRKGRTRRRASEESDMTEVKNKVTQDSENKLQELLDSAVQAQADGESEDLVSEAEAAARQNVIFARNGFVNFGACQQLEKRIYTDAELKEAEVNVKKLLTVDDTKSGVARGLNIFFAAFVLLSIILFKGGLQIANNIGLAFLALGATDYAVNGGSLLDLILDSIAQATNSEFKNRVAQHEAARFLVAYLLGVLPKAYTLSSADTLEKFQSTKINGSGCVLCQADFQRSVRSGKLSSKDVDNFVCIGLAGVVQEALMFGQAQTGGFNIQSVENLYTALSWEKRRMSDQTRWATLNVVTLLRRNEKLHAELAQAMLRGSRTASLMKIIEDNLAVRAA